MLQNKNMQLEIQSAISRFIQASQLATIAMTEKDIDVEILPAPHKPSKLPTGKMAVYMFFLDKECLKIGKAGANSNARYSSQHYLPKSANSTLAKSILMDRKDIPSADIKYWIMENMCRVNLLLDAKKDIEILNLLESFMQCFFKPKYEGFKSQKK